MKCIILAAGRGTRMGELTNDCPKPMLPIKGKPKLAYTIEKLPSVVTEVILVVGYHKQQIIDYFGDVYSGRRIRYVEQKEFNGTAGALTLTKEMIGDEKFLVLMGDDLYMKKDIERLTQYDLALLAYETQNAQSYGLVDIDEKSHLVGVVERPHDRKEGLVNTAAYALTPEYFDYALVAIGSGEYGLPQTIVTMRDHHEISVITTEHWFPVGTPEDLERAQKEIAKYLL